MGRLVGFGSNRNGSSRCAGQFKMISEDSLRGMMFLCPTPMVLQGALAHLDYNCI